MNARRADTAFVIGWIASLAIIGAILHSCTARHRYDAEYQAIGLLNADELNRISTILVDEHLHRDAIFAKHPGVLRGLNTYVKGNVDPAAKRYYEAERVFTNNPTSGHLEAMRAALADLSALRRAAEDVVATNSGTSL